LPATATELVVVGEVVMVVGATVVVVATEMLVVVPEVVDVLSFRVVVVVPTDVVVVEGSVSSSRPTRKMTVTTRTTNRPVRIQPVRFIGSNYPEALF
jgi:hypothetical protein